MDLTCPICGAREGGTSWSALEKDGFDIVRCPECTLRFRRVAPSSDELAALYDERYFFPTEGDGAQTYANYLADEDAHRANARRRLALLGRFVAPGRLLDVGCAAGFFLDEAERAGWQAQGVDISTFMSSWGRRELGATIQNGLLASVAIEPGSLDGVTMWDYIEHSTDPEADLATSVHLLRVGGLVALSTGDVDSLVARISGRRWHLLTPRHHNFFFSERTLRVLCANVRLDVIWIGHPGAVYSLGYLLYKARTITDTRLVRALGRGLEGRRAGSLKVPLNLGDIITVVGRKSGR